MILFYKPPLQRKNKTLYGVQYVIELNCFVFNPFSKKCHAKILFKLSNDEQRWLFSWPTLLAPPKPRLSIHLYFDICDHYNKTRIYIYVCWSTVDAHAYNIGTGFNQSYL